MKTRAQKLAEKAAASTQPTPPSQPPSQPKVEEQAEDLTLMDLIAQPGNLRCERITNHEAFLLPAVQQAMEKWRPATDVPAWVELVQQVVDGDAAVFAVGQGNTIYGMLIIFLPFNDLWPWPFVEHLHVEPGAPKAAKKMLVDAGVAFMKEGGYDRFWSMNVAGLTDEVWERVFRGAGTPERRGSVYVVQM